MADLPTRADLFAVGRRAIVTTPNQRINPAVVDIAGSDLNLMVGSSSLMGEEIVSRMSKCLRGLFVETAREDQLDRIAFDRYSLTRLPATAATVDLLLSRPTFVAGGGTYPAGGRVTSPTGTVFATDADAVFGPTDLSKSVSATALLTGSDGNVPASLLNRLLDSPFDPSITVNNPQGAAGGTEAETDVQFRGRIRDFFPTVRRGTLGAIEYGARQVAGVAVAKAIEVVNATPLPAAMVQVIVGDSNGAASSSMLSKVRNILNEYRAAGIPVDVVGGIVQYEVVQWDLDFEAGIDTASAREQVRAVTVAVGQFLRPGETLYRSSLIAGARTVPGVLVHDGSLVLPAGDIVVPPTTPYIILRIQSQDVSFT